MHENDKTFINNSFFLKKGGNYPAWVINGRLNFFFRNGVKEGVTIDIKFLLIIYF